jgi:hypothetical protein
VVRAGTPVGGRMHAVERTAPVGLICFRVVTLWYALHGHAADDMTSHPRSGPLVHHEARARGVCQPLQLAAAASSAAAASAPSGSPVPSRYTARSDVDRSSAACSTSTNPRRETADHGPRRGFWNPEGCFEPFRGVGAERSQVVLTRRRVRVGAEQ